MCVCAGFFLVWLLLLDIFMFYLIFDFFNVTTASLLTLCGKNKKAMLFKNSNGADCNAELIIL